MWSGEVKFQMERGRLNMDCRGTVLGEERGRLNVDWRGTVWRMRGDG